MKLYLVTRADLTLAQQAVQAAHAAVEYTRRAGLLDHPTIVMLVVRDEAYLRDLSEDVFARTANIVEFREPDMGGALTAFAALGDAAGRVLRGLPLMGQ